jgi:hypothetical protein
LIVPPGTRVNAVLSASARLTFASAASLFSCSEAQPNPSKQAAAIINPAIVMVFIV